MLLVTMALVIVTMVGALALGRWLRRVGERVLHRWPRDAGALRERSRIHTTPISADAERRLRSRQAAWRLRC